MVERTSAYVEERLSGPPANEGMGEVELSIESIYRQRGQAVVGRGGILRKDRSELDARRKRYFEKQGYSDANSVLETAGVDQYSDREFYYLSDDETYYVEFAQTVDVPGGCVGMITPSESLLAAGVTLHASMVDPGDEVASALLSVEEKTVLLQASSSIARLVILAPDPGSDSDD